MFLLPGTYDVGQPFEGSLYLGCEDQKALQCLPMTTLHGLMCSALGTVPENFIGFGAKYPLSPENMTYNSGTCNTYWFGTRTLPSNWQDLVWYLVIDYLDTEAPARQSDRRPTS